MKENKGITLIALVITIIVLLILAGVSIATLTGEHGILTQANNAKQRTEDAEADERNKINVLEEELDKYVDDITGKKVKNLVGKMTENTIAKDEYGNKIVIPKDFKVTNDTKKVNEGIVIEDDDGNQFVWIPVGEVSNGSTTKTVKLSRYTFASDGTPTEEETNPIIKGSYNYQELETSSNGNTTAKNLQGFINSANTNGGYYLGRYEASNNEGKVGSKYDKATWTNITQPNAAIAAREMYASNSSYTSDLINSYAWDTAIVFIQSFGQNSNYSNQTRLNTSKLNTGKANDEQLNINDMASNIWEWTTETYSLASEPCVVRGGHYYATSNYTAYRSMSLISGSYYNHGFRPLLYIQP